MKKRSTLIWWKLNTVIIFPLFFVAHKTTNRPSEEFTRSPIHWNLISFWICHATWFYNLWTDRNPLISFGITEIRNILRKYRKPSQRVSKAFRKSQRLSASDIRNMNNNLTSLYALATSLWCMCEVPTNIITIVRPIDTNLTFLLLHLATTQPRIEGLTKRKKTR